MASILNLLIFSLALLGPGLLLLGVWFPKRPKGW
jgi:hypothetical protein